MSSTDTNTSRSTSGAHGVVDQAKAFGRDVKDQVGDLSQQATDALKTQASNLTDSAKDLASDAGEKLRATVGEQKAAGADYVQGIAGMVRRSASEFENGLPQAATYIRKTADQLETVSDAMRNRNMSEIVGKVQDFARRQPTAFFGAAVLMGFAAVRFLKSGSDAATATSSSHATRPTEAGM